MKWFKKRLEKKASSNSPQTPKIQAFPLERMRTPSGLIDGLDDLDFSPQESPDIASIDSDFNSSEAENPIEIASIDLKSEALLGEPIPSLNVVEPIFESGVFTVGDSGEIEVDFLFDGGGYRGELAFFSLEGMESLQPDSTDFIAEAARRALSDSELGHIVISDSSEGAKFSANLPWEGNLNRGQYQGIKTFEMRPGDTFGVMLVPKGSVAKVLNNPSAEGALRPLFSLVTANPDDSFQSGQIADVTGDGQTFVFEDLRLDGKSDRDYNDIIFQIRGATGEAVELDEVIDPERDWRETDVGKELFAYAKTDLDPPEIAADLLEDTGNDNSDRITSNPTITGGVADESTVTDFQVKFSGQTDYTSITTQIDDEGNFTLSPGELETIFGSQVPDGTHTLQFQATDEHGNISNVFDYTFTLDTSTNINFGLDPSFDSTPIGDGSTELEIVTLSGQTEAGNTVILVETGATITADSQGNFSFVDVNLDLGENSFTVEVTDSAGNTSNATEIITRLEADSEPPVITANLNNDTGNDNNDLLTNDPTIVGTVSDESIIANFQVKFSGQTDYAQITTQLDGDGNFNLDTTELETIFGGQVPDGTHTLQFVATDEHGNISNVFDYTFTLDTSTNINFGLDPNFDSTPIGDGSTELEIVTLSGQTEAGNTVTLIETSTTITADSQGNFSFVDVNLDLGENSFTVEVTDLAGNTSNATETITRLEIDSEPPVVTASLSNDTGSSNSDAVTHDSTITGVVSDESSIANFQVKFSGQLNYTSITTQLDSDGNFNLDTTELEAIFGSQVPDGTHTLQFQASDEHGNISNVFDYTFTLDTSTNINFGLDPNFDSTPIGDGSTELEIVTLSGQTEAGNTVTLIETDTTITADSQGNFSFSNVNLNLGENAFTVVVTDAAGNTSSATETITRLEPPNSDIVLVENTTFAPHISQSITLPENPGTLSFDLLQLTFDTTDLDAINDAFEVALLDAQGNSLVHTLGTGRNSFFNLTEGETPDLAPGVTFDGQTVEVNLAGIAPGTEATLQLRLVNNDSDTTTTARINNIRVETATQAVETPSVIPSTVPSFAPQQIDFNRIEDISASIEAQYGQTSFNNETRILHSDLALHNQGQYETDAPLIVAIANLNDPSVRVINADGITPEGLPYFDFSSLVSEGTLSLGETSGERSLQFYNPNGEQFDYQLVILSQLNAPPEIESSPDIEAIIGRPYSYTVSATDLDGDSLTYELLSAPVGMSVDSNGEISWNPSTDDLGNHSVTVRVADGRGGIDEQSFTLGVIEAPPNRPPVFASTPTVDGRVNEDYIYLALALDVDGDDLTYGLLEAPQGMSIDSTTGVVSWTPTAEQLGVVDVVVEVSDGQGGTARQVFSVLVQPESGNHAPTIISEPVTSVTEVKSEVLLEDDFDGENGNAPAYYYENYTNWNITRGYTNLIGQGNGSVDDFFPGNGLYVNLDAFYDPASRLESKTTFDLQPGEYELQFDLANYYSDSNTVTVQLGNIFQEAFTFDEPTSSFTTITRKIQVSEPTSGKLIFDHASGDNQGLFLDNVKLQQHVQSYSYPVQALDPDGDRLSYTLLNAPNGMEIDAGGVISWEEIPTSATGQYEVTVQTSDGRGGLDAQTYTLSLPSILPGTISGSVFFDLDSNGVRGGGQVGDLGNIATDLQLAPRYAQDYSVYDLGSIPGVPPNYGDLTLAWQDSNTLLVGGNANTASGALYAINVVRGEGDHIIGFDGTATRVADAAYNDGGIVYNSDGTLFLTRWPVNELGQLPQGATTEAETKVINLAATPLNVAGSAASLTFVPEGYPGAGDLKLISWSGGQFYTLELSPDGEGTYNVDSATLETVLPGGPEGIAYIPLGSPQFDTPSVLISEYSSGNIAAYDVDGEGNPIVSSRSDFLPGLSNAEGAFVDPLTGDFFFSTFGGGDRVVAVRGFKAPSPSEPGIPNWLVYLDLDGDGARDEGEPFTHTDRDGNYSFAVAPGTYTVAQEVPPGWLQTFPSLPTHAATVASAQMVKDLDFGNTNNRALGAENLAPEITSTPATKVVAGEQFLYQAAATDLNGDLLTYDLTVKPEGMVVSPSGLVSWRPTNARVGTHEVILRVSDGYGGVDLQAFQVSVTPGNNNPAFVSSPPVSFQPVVGQTFQYQARALDADGDDITYRLVDSGSDNHPDNATIDPVSGIVTWTPRADQTGRPYLDRPWNITLAASDGKGGEAFQSSDFLDVISSTPPNQAPQITSTPRTSMRLGSTYSYALSATDPNNDPLTYTLATAPLGMTLDPSGRIFWQPAPQQLGTHSVTVEVSDSRGGLSTQTFTLDVLSTSVGTVPVANGRPEIASQPPFAATLGQIYAYNPVAVDPDGDPLLWSLDNAPTGMVIDPQTGALRWTPRSDQLGEQVVALRATDTQGMYTEQEFTVTVRGANVAPQITSTPPTVAVANQLYQYLVTANDPEGNALSFSFANDTMGQPMRPVGMAIDPHTGLITWTPNSSQLGSQTVSVVVTDELGATTTQDYTLVVGATAPNLPPSITSTPVYLARSGVPYTYQVTATDPEGTPLNYEFLNASDLPSGMSIDGNGELTWNNPQPGTYTIVIGANDGEKGAAQAFTLTVRDNSVPDITSTPNPTTSPGRVYRYDVIARDIDGDALTYAIENAPNGMNIDTLGRITWNVPNTVTGNYSVDVIVTDAFGGEATQQLNLNVITDTQPPSVLLQPVGNVYTVDTGSGIEYQVDISAQSTVSLRAYATDNLAVDSLQLLLDGTAVATNGNGVATVPVGMAGSTLNAVAIATDTAGNTTQETLELKFVDLSVSTDLILDLDLSNLPEEGITNPIEIIGTVADNNGNPVSYTLEVQPISGGEWITVFEGNQPVINGVLGVFDPTLLPNDTYKLRLTASDATGETSFVENAVDVTGELKLGNFQLSFTDLEVPVAGIPISVTRTYDSLYANQQDNFGYGWRLEFRDTDLKTSLRPPTPEEEILGESVPFADGTRVYITLPGGKRTSFKFQPKLHPEVEKALKLGAPWPQSTWFYQPEFVAEDGSGMTLSVKTETLLRNGNTGEYLSPNGLPYNPEHYFFGRKYTLTTKEGIEYEIDAGSGDLLTITDLNGNTLTYSDAGIVSSSGKEVKFERDARGRIKKVIDPMGEDIVYNYDEKGDLVSVIDREGNETKLFYEEPTYPHYLTRIEDPLGREGIRTEYDPETGRLSRMLDVNGEAVELVYDPENSTQTVRDVYGNPTTYVYDSRGNVLTEIDAVGKRINRTYDERNNLLTETVITSESGPQGWTTTYTYDGENNQLTETDPLGNTSRYTYNQYGQILTSTDPLGNTTTFTYDQRGNLLSSNDAEGNTVSFTYDLRGNLLSVVQSPNDIMRFEYDGFGNRTREVDALGNETIYTYDINGNVKTQTTTLTNSITGETKTLIATKQYDAEGNVVSLLDTENGLTQFEYDASGNQISIVDAEGRRTEYRYDQKNRLIETIYPDDTPNELSDNLRVRTDYDAAGNRLSFADTENRATRFKYDSLNRVTKLIYSDATPNNPDDNPRISVEYNQAGQMIATINEQGNRTEYEYDNAGRMSVVRNFINGQVYETRTLYDAAGREIAQIDAAGRKTEFKYDNLGQLIETIFPDKTRIKTEYDAFGNVTSTTDQAGRTIRYEYDANDQLTAVIDELGQRTEYRYDEAGNLISQKDAQNQITRYEYDGLGRRTAVVRPMGQRSETAYNEVGNVIRTTDFNGETIEYQYNQLNQLVSMNLLGEDPFIGYTYTATGQIHTVVDERGGTIYTYNERGLLESRVEPDGASIDYTYNDAGLVETVTTPSGTVSYEYDAFNRLKRVIGNEPSEITTYTYDSVGNLISTTIPNGTVETRGYDELNRLTSLIYTDANDTTLASYNYTLDDAGNRTRVEEGNGRRVEYTYDDLYRLTREAITDPVNGNRIIDYIYDEVGNRLTRNDSIEGLTTYVYDDNDRLLRETTGGETINYTYDDNGNLILADVEGSLAQTDYVWDVQNRLVGVTVTDAAGQTKNISYEYDVQGIRVSSTVDGVETRYLVDATRPYAQVLEEYTGEGVNRQTRVSYTYGLDLLSQDRGSDDLFYFEDGHSGVRQLSDESGLITDTYSYDAYGNLIAATGSSENNYLYRGEQFDPNADLQYLRARYYDPQTGRFPSVDPFEGLLEKPMTQHRYLYGNANPVMFVDPSGAIASLSEQSGWSVFLNQLSNALSTSVGVASRARSKALAIQTVTTLVQAAGIAITVASSYWGLRRGGVRWNGTLDLNKTPAYGAPAGVPTTAVGNARLTSSNNEYTEVTVLGASYTLAELINVLKLPSNTVYNVELGGSSVRDAMQTPSASDRGTLFGPFILSTLNFIFPYILNENTWIIKKGTEGTLVLGVTAGTANKAVKNVGEGNAYDGLKFDVFELGIVAGVSIPTG